MNRYILTIVYIFSLIFIMRSEVNACVNEPPVAYISTSTTTSAEVGETAHFYGSGTDPDPGDTLSYKWNFGDSSTWYSGASTTHVYSEPDTYTATFRVTDSGGLYDEKTVNITITPTNYPPQILYMGMYDSYDHTFSFEGYIGDVENDDVDYFWLLWDRDTSDEIDSSFGSTSTPTYNGIHYSYFLPDEVNCRLYLFAKDESHSIYSYAYIDFSIVNNPPTGSITDPTSTLYLPVGGSYTFRGEVDDSDDDNVEYGWRIYDYSTEEYSYGPSGSTTTSSIYPWDKTFSNAGHYRMELCVWSTGYDLIADSVEVYVVEVQDLTVSGADYFGGPSPKIYTTTQQSGANVTITAVLYPSVSVGDLPANFIIWTNGTAGANQLQKLVSRSTANTDVTVTAACGNSNKSARIYVRRVDDSNPTHSPDTNVLEVIGAQESQCVPAEPRLDTWHVSSVGNYWYPRIDYMTCNGIINIIDWPSNPTSITTPNTANPVDGGNITNTMENNGRNNWSLAIWDLGNYDTPLPIGGAGPFWHNINAIKAHEWYHWNTDWMSTCIQTVGNWSNTETDIESLSVSVFSCLTEADAKAALTASVNSRFTTFKEAAVNHWEDVIQPADLPGMGAGAYGEAQAVLDADIAAIQAYAISKGWLEE